MGVVDRGADGPGGRNDRKQARHDLAEEAAAIYRASRVASGITCCLLSRSRR